MDPKFLVYRVHSLNGRREFKRTKCSNFWSYSSVGCWRFSYNGAKSIVDRFNRFSRGFYIYGFEVVYD